jgi:chorismate dehydratase
MTVSQNSHEPRPIRLGAVEYLNARPLVYRLDRSARFALRYDLPSECARLLHSGDIDVGLVPSIEYLRGGPYHIVPDLAIASRGPVASVALYTTRPMSDVRSIAMDTSSRTSVALARVLCTRLFEIDPALQPLGPDLPAMLDRCDAALVIGDNALLWDGGDVRRGTGEPPLVEKIDLGDAWTRMTGLPFVWAFWAGRPGVLRSDDVRELKEARDAGVGQPEAIAREYFGDAPDRQSIGARYLRDNIKYYLGDEELAGLRTFFRYAVEAGVVAAEADLRFY